MTSSVFPLRSMADGLGLQQEGRQAQNHAACEHCYIRKQRCISGQGEHEMLSLPVYKPNDGSAGSCLTCASLGIECKPRERNKTGRPRGTRQPSWRADVRSSRQNQNNNLSQLTAPVRHDSRSSSSPFPASSTFPELVSHTNNSHGDMLDYSQHDATLLATSLNQSSENEYLDLATNGHEYYETFASNSSLEFILGLDSQSPSPSSDIEDLKLYDVHSRIRKAIGSYRSSTISNDHALQRTDVDDSMRTLEDLTTILQPLAYKRAVYLLGLAVLWDAIELGRLLATDLVNQLPSSGQGRPSTSSNLYNPAGDRSRAGPSILGHNPPMDLPMNIASPSLTLASLTGRRPSAIVVMLTRLGVCLGEFISFVRKFESSAGTSITSLDTARSFSDCLTRISALLEEITPYIHRITSTWSALEQR
nr:hypothetical protein CFP56_78003 [Quercus suber]